MSALAGSLALLAAPAGAHDGAHADGSDAPPVVSRVEPAGGAERLYEPPAPGTYRLPAIQEVADHALLGPDGELERIVEPADEATVVAFVYRGCSDPDGCPLSFAVLRALDRALAEEPELAEATRLVTVSFDPEHDTPAAMGALAKGLAPRGRWSFLTAESREALAPVLADYGQDAAIQVDEAGAPTGLIGHVLKVFLVDGERRVRNIYSVGYLDPLVLRNDIATILADPPASSAAETR